MRTVLTTISNDFPLRQYAKHVHVKQKQVWKSWSPSSPVFPGGVKFNTHSFDHEDANISFNININVNVNMAQDEVDAMMPRLVNGELSSGLYNPVVGDGEYE